MIQISEDICKGCGLCIVVCPEGILELGHTLNKRGVPFPQIIDESRCTDCQNCMIYCPDFAIVVTRVEKQEIR